MLGSSMPILSSKRKPLVRKKEIMTDLKKGYRHVQRLEESNNKRGIISINSRMLP